MADAEELPVSERKARRFWPRRKRWQYLLVLLILLLVVSLFSWRSREEIAQNLIESQLRQLGIEARYEIESISATQQVLRNLTIGDPERPDLSIERVELTPRVGFSGPAIGTLRLVRPRLRASYLNGELSLGALDPLLESESDERAALPDWNLELVGARARVVTESGIVGLAANGSGRLSGGFAGSLGLVAPELSLDGCEAGGLSFGGRITVEQRQPRLSGPLNLAGLSCGDSELTLGETQIAVTLTADRDLAGMAGEFGFESGAFEASGFSADNIAGPIKLDWRDGIANSKFELAVRAVKAGGVELGSLSTSGAARARPGDGRIELDAGIEGNDIALSESAREMLAGWRDAAEGTLAAPLLAKFDRALASALPSSTLVGEVTLRQSAERFSLVVPAARLRSEAGQNLLAVSQFQYGTDAEGEVQLAGNIASEGGELPRIRGRMEQAPGGKPELRLDMAPYRAEGSMLAIPRLRLAQDGSGSITLAGHAVASGAIPGGTATDFELPISGRWSPRTGLAMWQECSEVRFARLELAGLQLIQDRIEVCPHEAGAVLRTASSDNMISAKIDDLQLSGLLGGGPIEIAASDVRFTSADGLQSGATFVTLGGEGEESRFALAGLNAGFGEGPSGSLSGVEVQLAAVPLDIVAGGGEWRYADGVFELSGASFQLNDRAEEARFEPLVARDAVLTFADNRIVANAAMRHPDTDRLIVNADLLHDLSNGTGFADLDVPGIVFDDQLEPAARIDQCDEDRPRASGPTGLTCLASGVIALAKGMVTGSGRIDWNPDEITSSGSFSTESFDFAAAFGPVAGVSGTVHFSDLLSLTTDGTQSLKIGSINPGVEVFDGVFDFALRDGTKVSLRGGRWPFFGGTMVLRPTELDLAVSEERSYVIEITGADAAQFVTEMEMGNLSVTGIFDGAVPLVFDEMGNGEIMNGLLISRPPGGNVSYVGELTYEDAGAIANFAFDSLRSLDFSQMSVEMNGPLSGEIITRLLFDGISQGEGASRNFVTRQIAKLPIRFNVNIRASFYELLTDLRSMYDPAFIRDPRSLGLIRTENGQLVRPSQPDQPAIRPDDIAPDESSIQPDESEILP